MQQALIGLLGVLMGLLINEHFRRHNRIEAFSSRIFDKRLEIYEKLMALLDNAAGIIEEVLENDDLSKYEKNAICHPTGLELMEFCDANQLYLNDEITVQIGGTFANVADIIDIEDPDDKANEILRFRRSIGDTKKMIKAESGIQELNNLFLRITKAKHSSPIIDYYRSIKKNRI